ncbi:signal transduction histidine kinase [Catenuloplanes nepalensis]|uniref:histidine kinase n=1 Tax=Catenuloplanes nepalensis TaxID=587533 RepID=A0ABT9MMZ1_9ACTN|nr:sensor histidine kinase [Catenuloplanes nepalensis]MDP9792754.1 signal transduction histidine kinase [Catenuloplanes nepalensis]
MATAALARLRAAGRWRVAYEIGLTLLVTAVVVLAAVTDPVHPFAPWLEGIAAPIVLLLRLRHPLPAYLAAALIGLVTGGANTVLLVVMSASLAYRAPWVWQVAAGLAGGWAAFTGAIWWWEGRPDLTDLVLASALFALFALIPAGAARMVRRRRVLLAAMHRRNVQLHSQQGEVARAARARERTRIARDLHDSLGHKLTLISLYAGMRSAGDEHAELLRETSAAAMTELRQILGLLGQDDEQPSVRSLDGLDELCTGARASGATVEIIREGTARPLAPLTEHAAYRVIQEGVTNALRHAHGGTIVVSLRYEPDALVAGVTNTAGQRIARQTSGQGLLGLAERVRVAHGMLYHGPTPDGGFRLAATLPYPGDSAAPAPAVPDFAELVERDRRGSRRTLIATTLGILGVLALCCSGLWLTAALVVVDRDTYVSVRVGQSEREARDLLPDPQAGLSDVAGGRDVPGADCVDYQASPLDPDGLDRVYRFCFRDGTLVDKQEFLDQRP